MMFKDKELVLVVSVSENGSCMLYKVLRWQLRYCSSF